MKKLFILLTMLFSCGTVQAQQPKQNNYNFYLYKPNISITGVLLPERDGGSQSNYNSRLQYYQRLQNKRQQYYKKLQQQRFYQLYKRQYGGFGSFITNIRL